LFWRLRRPFVQLGGSQDAVLQTIKFSADDTWIVVQRHLSSEIAGDDLNEDYRLLRSLLDEAGKESLRVEELAWLNKRDAIKNPQERLEFTNARVASLEDRIHKLRK